MIDINNLRSYYEQERVIITIHAQERLRQRGIRAKDVRNCIMTGEIIEQYPDDFPFPSCLIFGQSVNEKNIACCRKRRGNRKPDNNGIFPRLYKV